jgi:hypothetical protein
MCLGLDGRNWHRGDGLVAIGEKEAKCDSINSCVVMRRRYWSYKDDQYGDCELFYIGFMQFQSRGWSQFGEPKTLFRIAGTSKYGAMSDFQFDVTRDGQRFIISTTASRAPQISQ